MKAEWILTDEERVTKQQKMEENRRLRQMLYPETDKVSWSKIYKNYLFDSLFYRCNLSEQ